MATTLTDIAEEAGLSITTVSQILNNKATYVRIRPDTIERVRKIAADRGYYPHAFAQGLVRKQANNIGFLLASTLHGHIANPFFAKMLAGIEIESRERGQNVVVSVYPKDETTAIELPHKVRARLIDGLIIAGFPPTFLLKALKAAGIPSVLAGNYVQEINVDAIVSDNLKGGRLAAQHLIELGHRNIVAFSSLDKPIVADRYQGFKQALVEHEQENYHHLIELPGGDVEDGYRGMLIILKSFPETTGIFAGGDLVALGAMKAAQEKGFRIPEDFSVIGYDDLNVASIYHPSLTTVASFPEQMGKVAVDRLMERIENKRELIPEKITVLPEIVVRESTGKVRDSRYGHSQVFKDSFK